MRFNAKPNNLCRPIDYTLPTFPTMRHENLLRNTLCGVGERNVVSGPGTSMATKSPMNKQQTRIRTMASGLSSNGAVGGMKLTQDKVVDPFDDLMLEKVAPASKNATKLNSTPHAVASGNAVNGLPDAF